MMIYFERLRYTRRSEILKKFSAAGHEGDRQATQFVFNPFCAYESCQRAAQSRVGGWVFAGPLKLLGERCWHMRIRRVPTGVIVQRYVGRDAWTGVWRSWECSLG
jgi:hypothetical protein